MSAPASSGGAATAALVVSTLIGTSGNAARMAGITGKTRRGFLGRVDLGMARPGGFAADVEDVRAFGDHAAAPGSRPRPGVGPLPAPSNPSPENESGVTLTMPITKVRWPQWNVRAPIFNGRGGRGAMPAYPPRGRRTDGVASICLLRLGVGHELVRHEQVAHPTNKVERTAYHQRPAGASGNGERRVERPGPCRRWLSRRRPTPSPGWPARASWSSPARAWR